MTQLNDPTLNIFNKTPQIKDLLSTFGINQQNEISNAIGNLGYRPPGIPYTPEVDQNVPVFNPNYTQPSFKDAVIGTGALGNLTVKMMGWADRNIGPPMGLSNYFVAGPGISSSGKFDANAWFSAPENIKYLNDRGSQVAKLIQQKFVLGEYDDVTNANQFYAEVGNDIARQSWKESLVNMSPALGITASALGVAISDPLSLLPGMALGKIGEAAQIAEAAGQSVSLPGKVSSIFTAAENASFGQKLLSSGAQALAYSATQEAGSAFLGEKHNSEEIINNVATNLIFNTAFQGITGLTSYSLKPLIKQGKGTTGGGEVAPQAPIPAPPMPPTKPGITPEILPEHLRSQKDISVPTELESTLKSPESIQPAAEPKFKSPEVQPPEGLDTFWQKLDAFITSHVDNTKAPENYIETFDALDELNKQIAEEKSLGIGQGGQAGFEDVNPDEADVTEEEFAALQRQALESSSHLAEEAPGLEAGAPKEPINNGPNGSTLDTMPDGTGGYDWYKPYIPKSAQGLLGKFVRGIDKIAGNSLFGKPLTMAGILSSDNGMLHMVYQKFFNTPFISKAVRWGKTIGAAPFEDVVSKMRTYTVQNILGPLDSTFRNLMKLSDPSIYNRLQMDKGISRDLWRTTSGLDGFNMVQRENAFYSIIDLMRARLYRTLSTAATAASEGGRFPILSLDKAADPSIFDARFDKNLKEINDNPMFISLSQHTKEILAMARSETLSKWIGEAMSPAFEKLYDASGFKNLPVGDIPSTQSFWENLDRALYKDYAKISTIRPKGNAPVEGVNSQADLESLLQKTSIARTAVSLPDDITPAEFATFWNATAPTEIKIKPGQSAMTGFLQQFADKGVIESRDISLIRDQQPGWQSKFEKIKNFWEKQYGGFIPSDSINSLILHRRDNGDLLVNFDARKTVLGHLQYLESVEYARTINNLIEEGSQWDQGLAEKFAAISKEPGLRPFDALGEATDVMSDPKYLSFDQFNDLREFNKNATDLLREHIKYHADENTSPVVIDNFFDGLEKRAQIERNYSQKTGGEKTNQAGRIFGDIGRSAFLASGPFNALAELSQGIVASAISPMKGTLLNYMTNLFSPSLRGGKAAQVLGKNDMNFLIDNLTFAHDSAVEIMHNRTAEGGFNPLEDIIATKVGFPKRVGAFFENVLEPFISKGTFGSAMYDKLQTASAWSTLHELTYKGISIVEKVANALDKIEGGESTWMNSLKESGADNYLGNQVLKYMTPEEIKIIRNEIQADTTNNIAIPRRFYLDHVLGKKEFKVLDLPEGADQATTEAYESLGLLANHLASHEKMSYSSWGDDFANTQLLGKGAVNGLGSLVLRPLYPLFNRMIIGSLTKDQGTLLANVATSMAIASAADLLWAYSSGKKQWDNKMNQLTHNPIGYFANRLAWSGVLGPAGPKSLEIFRDAIGHDPVSNIGKSLLPSSVRTIINAVPVARGLAQAPFGGASKDDADASYKMMNALGFVDEMAAFRFLSKGATAAGAFDPDAAQTYWENFLNVKNNGDNK